MTKILIENTSARFSSGHFHMICVIFDEFHSIPYAARFFYAEYQMISVNYVDSNMNRVSTRFFTSYEFFVYSFIYYIE